MDQGPQVARLKPTRHLIGCVWRVGTPMMARGRLKSLIVMVCVAAITVLSLTACGASKKQDAQYIQDLKARGFIDPVFAREGFGETWYDVTVGTCRISVWSTSDGWSMSVPRDSTVDITTSQLNVKAIKAHANELGLAYCFGGRR